MFILDYFLYDLLIYEKVGLSPIDEKSCLYDNTLGDNVTKKCITGKSIK